MSIKPTKFNALKADSLEVTSSEGQAFVVTLKSLGTLTAAAFKDGIRMAHDFEITDIRASVVTAPTGAALNLDVNKNGTTLFTTQANRPIVAIAGTTSSHTAPDVTTGVEGDVLSLDVDQIGSTIAGANLFLTIKGNWTS